MPWGDIFWVVLAGLVTLTLTGLLAFWWSMERLAATNDPLSMAESGPALGDRPVSRRLDGPDPTK